MAGTVKLPGWEQLRGRGYRACPFLGPRVLPWGCEDSKITPSQEGQGATSVLSDPSHASPWKPLLKAPVPGDPRWCLFFFCLTSSHAFCLALSSCMGCDLPLGWYHVTVSLFSLTQPQSLLAIFASHALPLALLILPVLHLAILVGFSQILKILFRGTVVRQLWFPTPVTQHSGGWSRGLLSGMPVWG